MDGHRVGASNVQPVIMDFSRYGIKCLTFYAFSTENRRRPRAEVGGILRIIGETIAEKGQFFRDNGIRLRHIGSLDGLPSELKQGMLKSIEATNENVEMVVTVALNYGGRAEILEAARRVVGSGIHPENIGDELFSRNLYTAGLPDPDLIIRTGGEVRLSNFLLWQSAYSEFYYTTTLWPDFRKDDIERALISYSGRRRRFGSLEPQR